LNDPGVNDTGACLKASTTAGWMKRHSVSVSFRAAIVASSWDKFMNSSEARVCGLIDAVLLNGSFVTAENEPNDIDLVVVVSSDHDFSAEF
jgi:hypothetical protein